MKKEIYICQESEWHNAFGETDHFFEIGMRVTLLDTRYIAGTRFLSFKESPKGNWYQDAGFKPLRELN